MAGLRFKDSCEGKSTSSKEEKWKEESLKDSRKRQKKDETRRKLGKLKNPGRRGKQEGQNAGKERTGRKDKRKSMKDGQDVQQRPAES